MYCLDTNIVIDILRGDSSLKSKVDKMQEMFDIFITNISLCELYRGAYGHFSQEKKIRILEEFISNFGLLTLDKGSCEEFGRTYIELEKSGKLVGDFDLMIASIVKSKNLILITRDKKDFENTGVKVEFW